MFEQFQAIEQSLKIWRGVVLVLTIIMLLISLLADDDMAVIFLIICMFALILFQMPNMPTTSYQVHLSPTQLFIMLLVAFSIFVAGSFFESFYDKSQITSSFVIKNVYNMLTMFVFIIVLWRHYQKDERNLILMKFSVI
jgi:hypothetical protein